MFVSCNLNYSQVRRMLTSKEFPVEMYVFKIIASFSDPTYK